MKLKKLISKYNFLTVLFAVLTFGSVGAICTGAPMFTVMVVGCFAYLTAACYAKEESLRSAYKRAKRAKARRAQFTVYSGKSEKKVSIA